VIIIINGQSRQLAEPLTIEELLRRLEMPSRGVAVEVNYKIVRRAEHATCQLADGDRLEIVSLVGGG